MKLETVLNDLADALRKTMPGLKKIYLERISKLETPSISIEVTGYNPEQLDAYGQNKELSLDIIYFAEHNSMIEAITATENIIATITPGFWAGDRFIKPDEKPTVHYVDQDAHIGVMFAWHDDTEHYEVVPGTDGVKVLPDKDIPLMQTLTYEDMEGADK